jgi:YidC/Oxa1 family membrane protein insertase
MSGFLGVPVGAAYYLVSALVHLLTPVAGGLAAVAAIVLFTAVVRLLIAPLSLRALRGQAAMARLAPQIQALQKRYGRQPERFQRELTTLYKREGTSPFASLLPLLAQWPFLSVTYLLFRSGTVNGASNQLLSDGLFGVPLGAHWLSGAGLLSVHDALFVAVFAVLAALCWATARLARRTAPAAVPAPVQAAVPPAGRQPAVRQATARQSATRKPAARKPAAPQSAVRQPAAPQSAGRRPAAGARPDPAEVLANSKTAGLLTRVLPYLTVVFAAFAPLAAAIYLLTTVAWTLGERRLFLHRTTREPQAGAAQAQPGHGEGRKTSATDSPRTDDDARQRSLHHRTRHRPEHGLIPPGRWNYHS